ncbi:MAG: bifunctional N(6)-L-threonylcarbamoyladenine synthase/serine/threonine protein kinase [Candidatus Woesearchaeota archaeon]
MKLKCLGIESTAHTFGSAVVDDKGNVFSNERDLFTTEEGGMKPFDVAEHHVKVCDEIIKRALDKANCKIKDIDLIAFSQGPGLGQALKIGAYASRVLALNFKKPIVGVNHCIAHQSIGELKTCAKDPVLLYASGANTQIIAYDGGKYRLFGETLDIGVGNFLDSFARYLGLGFPGGPKIEALARNGKKLIELPYVVKGMDVSFGGLLTNLKTKWNSGKYAKEDLCYSLQETAFAMLVEISERAMAHCEKNELVIGGGVGCNKRLQEMCKIMCDEYGGKFYCPENQFLVDNAAMIAWQGILEYNAGKRQKISETQVLPYWRTDDVVVNWKKEVKLVASKV